MCGVAGIYAYHYASNPVDRDELVRIRDHMRRRGPDAEGAWFSDDGHVGLGHRRLTIIDLDARSNQPMVSAEGDLVISFNGEIYNYRALRQELERAGCRFRTQSDTEVLLQLYRLRGEAMFAQLRGMYALALWDAQKKALLLARDPYGIKPLYYADDGWTCRVASQVKALLAGGKVSRDPEPAGIVGFYLLGSVPEPYTLYQEIRAVPAGSFVWVTAIGAHEPKQFFSIAKVWADAFLASPSGRGRPEGAGEGAPCADDAAVRTALLDSVRHHLVADVPVGAFLSAGIDSGALVGLMRDAGQQHIKTVTVAFDEFRDRHEDESPLAAETARSYGTDHRTRRVTHEEFLADLPRILDAMDQPSIDGINTWFVAKATAEQGLKVAISGLGGDELFGGYATFADIPRWVRWLRIPGMVPGAGAAFRALAAVLLPGVNPKVRGMLQYGGDWTGAWFLKRGLFMPWELKSVLDPGMVRQGLHRLRLHRHLSALLKPDPGTVFARVSALESSLYMRNQLLRDTDWASMAHSLEVRVPLVDSHLLRSLAPVFASPRSRGEAGARSAVGEGNLKHLLANSPSAPLPPAVLARTKTGFSIPVAQWLQEHRNMDQWRRVPSLTHPNTPWARRWSHVVGSRFAGAPA